MPPPDDNKDLREIFFLEVTKTIIDSEDSLDILYEVNGPSRNDMLPSWAIDYEPVLLCSKRRILSRRV
jgi:hypothetical protein